MKIKLLTTLIAFFMITIGSAQALEALYEIRDYRSLVKYAENADSLSGVDLYYVGYAYFQLEDDDSAIKMYDLAIDKGLNEDYVYLYKGLSYRYSGDVKSARKNFIIAVEKDSTSQKNLTELGNSYYFAEDYDKALEYLIKARELPYEFGDPYIKVPNIYHIQNLFKEALEEYHISSEIIDKEDPVYLELLSEIGLLEFLETKNYANSIIAYEKALAITPEDYSLFPKLIKAYNSNKDYSKADSLFNVMKEKYERNELPESYMKYGDAPIAEFEWNGRKLVVYKNFELPKEMIDEMYKVYLLGEDGSSVERTFITEKSLSFKEGEVSHLMCERFDGGHATFSYGWRTDDIKLASVQEIVIAILNEEVSAGASSSYGESKGKKKNREKKKKKKKKKKK